MFNRNYVKIQNKSIEGIIMFVHKIDEGVCLRSDRNVSRFTLIKILYIVLI